MMALSANSEIVPVGATEVKSELRMPCWAIAARTSSLRGLGIQEWLSFYFKAPDSAKGVYPEHDLFIQSMKMKNTLRHIMGEDLITHLGLEYYEG